MVYYAIMKAVEIINLKVGYVDGSIREMVVWKLPRPSKDRPHGFKYRFHYEHQSGTTWIRYDNERGKGDHRHVGKKEEPYLFRNIEKLVADFMADVKHIRSKKP
jgi:Family of unknown function (DUF6516)